MISGQRDALIKKGLIYSPGTGLVDFTVPLFDDYIRRLKGELIVRHQNATGAGAAPWAGPGDQVIVRWHEEANLVLAG